VKNKEGGRGLLQIELTHKAEMTNIADYLNTKYIGYQFINIVNSQESSQLNMNSTIKGTARVAEKLNELNENNDTINESI
jgi:hypothetical protein